MDEDLAYAEASWARLDDEIGDELLRAICGAFAIVATADGDLRQSEVDRFAKMLRENADRFPRLDVAMAEGAFRELSQAILTDPAEGQRRALARIAGVRGDETHRDLVIGAARIAIEADERVLDCEERILDRITTALT